MYILAIDQGTSSTKSLIFDTNGNVIAKGSVDLKTDYFPNGFVEQNPIDIWQNVQDSVNECFDNFTKASFSISDIKSIGISNQRETFVLWDKTGEPLAPAVVWACKRSVQICNTLKAKGVEPLINQKTGLIIDPYFSGTKLLWLVENEPIVKEKLNAGELYFGTVDTWLLYKMTDGQAFATDHTDASRTLFMNLESLDWDAEILKKLGLSQLNLPKIQPSASYFGNWQFSKDHSFPITALIGDSHASLFGEGCFETGETKATLGTGCSLLMNIGSKPVLSKHQMLTTIGWSSEKQVQYAFEGAIVSCGSSVEWLKNEMNLFTNPAETAAMAQLVADSGGVTLIPAFAGLGAPHWQMDRKASVQGLTFGTSKNHIVRACLEAIAFQINDVLEAMKQDLNLNLKKIAIHGGLSKNEFVINCLSQLSQITIESQVSADISALGAAMLSGLGSGIFSDINTIKSKLSKTKLNPKPIEKAISDAYKNWKNLI